MTRLYLRPLGFLWGIDAHEAVGRNVAGRLAGGSGAFALVEVIRRDGAKITREITSYGALRKSGEGEIRERLESISASRGKIAGLDVGTTRVMGVVNITPDSFSDGGRTPDRRSAVEQGLRLSAEGADILDVGGESTRPGSEGVTLEEERRRVVAAVEELSKAGLLVSIDTRKPEIMSDAVAAGARIINDVSALTFDAASASVAASLGVPVVLMHAKGDSKTMQINPVYDDVVLDVYDELSARVAAAERAGLPRSRLLVDPGIGFGKTFRHNAEILKNIAVFHGMGVALVLGASRKAFLGAITGEKRASDRGAGSIGAAIAGVAQGVQILRVHDVKETVHALKVWRAAREPESSGL
jgi:dihydropteroate synthase